ncbi:flavin-containing monooxygenase FMO GS-OX-like 8 [Lotus japonicus]|uniref:flavin-containing monooxygenase FMO GS-OX-like 8 n=1 Tax=Lotus japonicus TaxID=34305 RepID=UPI0025894FC4|nr:flavin-containing monooxygenase FMO GS-OX-like 8 [Lotus japonicus]
MVSKTNQNSKNVCVIGAGPSGLVATRELKREGHKVVVFEQNHDIGGQWLYNPNVQCEDPLGKNPVLKVHSSIYESLRLMSPREIMGFTDFPFLVKKGRDMRRFPGHRELLFYLNDFCEWFGLREVIRFNTRVEYVGPLNYNGAFSGNDDLKWVVRSKEKESDGVVEEVFDAVVVASGHYSHPKLPCIQGMDTWKRKQMHSHIYRTPQPFGKEIVVVVGNSFSGQEISMDLVKVAKEVHLSSNSAYISEGLSKVIHKYQNFHLHPQIDNLQEDGRVIFTDGSSIQADTILYCTGYSYVFPFLDTKGMVVIEDNRVGPLYEHTFPPSLAPSLSFMGIPSKVLGPHFFESQAKWIAQLLSGKKILPSFEEMMKSIKELYHSREVANVPKRYTHSIADNDGFEYFDKYGDNAGFPKLEKWRKEICISSTVNMFANLETFRDSWNDDEMLQEVLKIPYFTQLGDHGFEN